jgi:hypothetical protein
MSKLLKEEVDKIKNLMIYESGDIPSTILKEQEEKETCVTLKVNGTFDVNATENPKNLEKFIEKFNKIVNENPKIKEAASEGAAYISYFEVVGGASNVGGGKSVKPTLGNDWYAPKSDGKKYEGDQAAQIKLAMSRGKNVSDWFKEKLVTDYKLPMGTEDKPAEIKPIRGEVIDTGGVNDTKRDEDLYPQPGQVVIVKLKVCGLSPDPGGGLTQECFTDLVVQVSYDEKALKHLNYKEHVCDSAIFEIQANGVTLEEVNGEKYANLNNLRGGGYKYATFRFSEGVNKDNIQTMIQNGVTNNYEGKLIIEAICGGTGANKLSTSSWKCISGRSNESKTGLGCHKGVAHLSASRSGKTIHDQIGMSPRCLNDRTTLGAIEACKPV